MYPHNFYNQSNVPINIQSQLSNIPMQMNCTLINDKPIQSSCEQILQKLPTLISQSLNEDKYLEKTLKSQLSNLKEANKKLTNNTTKYETKLNNSSKCFEKYKNEQKKVITLLNKLTIIINNQCSIISNQHDSENNIWNPDMLYDNLLESFAQMKELLIDYVTVIQKDLQCALASEERECVLLYEMIDKGFNEILSEVTKLNINEDININKERIGNIYFAIEEIQSLLVSVPTDIIEQKTIITTSITDNNNSNDIMNTFSSTTTNNLLEYATFNGFILKREQIRMRKRKLNTIYY